MTKAKQRIVRHPKPKPPRPSQGIVLDTCFKEKCTMVEIFELYAIAEGYLAFQQQADRWLEDYRKNDNHFLPNGMLDWLLEFWKTK